MVTRDCIPEALSKLFYVYGKFVARFPLPFIIAPILITSLFLIGLINLETVSDAEYLYAPVDGPSKEERSYFQDTYAFDDDGSFSSLRLTTLEGFLQIHIQDKTGDNVLNEDAIAAINDLNVEVLNYESSYNGEDYVYTDLCATWNGNCEYSALLQILAGVSNIADANITYPFHTLPSGATVSLIQELGDVTKDENDYVTSARAIHLSYYVKFQNDNEKVKSTKWLDDQRDKLLKFSDSRIEIAFQTSLSLEQELENAIESIIPLFVIAYNILCIFSCVSCMLFDWVRSKPWVAMGGLVAAALGIASSLGLMSAAGIKFASVVGTMPFLLIGIGIDDMFIIISAWRYTSVRLSTEERVGQTLKSAAVSITITSITDALAFGIGCLTPFRSVTIFCAYTGMAVVFVYFYMITFTVACLTYSGRREEANRHAFSCLKVFPKSEAGDRLKGYQLFCTGGSPTTKEETQPTPTESESPLKTKEDGTKHEQELKEDIHLPFLNTFLGTTFANFIMKVPVRIVIVLVYLGLFAVAIYGITILQEGLDRANLASDGSYFRDYFEVHQRDFASQYGPVVMVSLDESIDYSDQSKRDDIYELIDKFQDSRYFENDETFVTFWLNAYLGYLSQTNRNISIITIPDFISILQGEFLTTSGYDYFDLDIVFNNQNTSILSSRFFMQSTALKDAVDEQNMMLEARDIAKDSKFDVEVFSPPFIFYDQYAVIAINTLQNIGVAVASMLIVSLVLIPSFITVIWVTLGTVSICCCVTGYMALWDVSLDSVSMINLVMCIGFSVDFAAHISYHFVISEADDPVESARDALGYLGTPIVQGALSTILGVLVLATADTYIFRTFFKLVFLVMVFGFFHAMFLLPVLLATVNCMRCKRKREVASDPEFEKPKLGTKEVTVLSIKG